MTARKFFAVAAVAGGLVLGACGGEYNRDDFVSDLTESGDITEAQANCVADGVEENFSIDRLEGNGDLTDEERSLVIDITTDCILGG